VALRRQLRKNALASLLLAQGLPLLLAGDEVGNSQNGNNNAIARIVQSAGSAGASRTGGRRLTDFVGP